VPDAFEDVYFGEYQKNNRLDIASKMWGTRYISTIILMIVLIVVTKNLYLTVVVSTIFTFAVMILFIFLTKEYVSEYERPRVGRVFKQLLVTLPLALGAFLTLYIGWAPRDAIDMILKDETIQAIYNYLSMPVFVVQMMVTFIFNPRIYHISCLWNDRKISDYMKETMKQVAFVVAITLICIAGAAVLGVPVLSMLFNVDLKPYKLDLLIMLVGSGCLGMATLLGNLLTVMRYQNAILVGYVIVSVISFFFMGRAVMIYNVRGAVVFYVAILFLLSLIFAFEFAYGVLKARKTAPATGVK
jgi:O-antigen/teichoic acid export membrane protein